MKFKNAVICHDDFTFRTGGFTVNEGVFECFEESEEGIDLNGDYVIPGLIDAISMEFGEDFVTDRSAG